MDSAKELLLCSRMSLDEIALAAGFVDGKSLIRVFKKLEGVTPGRFREVGQKPD